MFELTGNHTEYEQMKKFYALARAFAEHTWDSMLEPLVGKGEFQRRFDRDDVSREAWRSLAEEPLGWAIERYLQNDLVRGLVLLADAKIGVFTHPHDPSLLQNRCFIYHLIGNKTGEWKVPVGGMGAVAREVEAARASGAEMLHQGPSFVIAAVDGRNQRPSNSISMESASQSMRDFSW